MTGELPWTTIVHAVRLSWAARIPEPVFDTVARNRDRWFHRVFVLALGFALAATLVSAGGDGEGDSEQNLPVVASIKPVHSLVSAVMAGVGEPHLIIKGAQSPHTFSMRPSDAAALAGARVIFLIDEHKEVALANPIANLGDEALVVQLAGAEGLVLKPLREGGAFEMHDHGEHDEDEDGHHEGDDHDEDEADHHEDDANGEDADQHEGDAHGHGHDHEHGDVDFHVWLDPENAVLMTYAIVDALIEADPENAATYDANAHALIDRLDALLAEIDGELAPVRDKPFIVRVIRIVPAARAVPRIALGMRNMPRLPSGSSAKGIIFIEGDQPHQIAGNTMTMIPSQKLGVARPMTATVRPA